jgi:hypothetical protein
MRNRKLEDRPSNYVGPTTATSTSYFGIDSSATNSNQWTFLDYLSVVLIIGSVVSTLLIYMSEEEFDISNKEGNINLKVCIVAYYLGLSILPYHVLPNEGIVLSYISYAAFKWFGIGSIINIMGIPISLSKANIPLIKSFFALIPGSSFIFAIILLYVMGFSSAIQAPLLVYLLVIDFFAYLDTFGRLFKSDDEVEKKQA